jgi:hypothetical protein
MKAVASVITIVAVKTLANADEIENSVFSLTTSPLV